MKQSIEFDSNNAFTQVRSAIAELMTFTFADREDDMLYAVNKLKSVLRSVHDNYQSWNRDTIREFVLSKNDPLRFVDLNSDQFNARVRNIQHDMITKFSIN